MQRDAMISKAKLTYFDVFSFPVVYFCTNATSPSSGASLENSQERRDGTKCSDSTQPRIEDTQEEEL